MTNRIVVRHRRAYLLGSAILVLAALPPVTLGSQDQATSNVQVKRVPAHPTTMVQGKALYKNYCAACHGTAGKGDGPAAAALKSTPADLTLLARNNNGKFPDLKVMHTLESGAGPAAHGSKDMPIWGPIFLSMGPAGAGSQVGRLREANLTDYIKSIQQK